MQPPQLGRLHAADLQEVGYLWIFSRLATTGLPAVVVSPTGAAGAMVIPAWAVVVPTRAAVIPTGTALPGALTMPVALVAGFTVEVAVIVAAAPVPVASPARVPELSRTPVIVRERGHRLGLSDARRANAGKSKTRDDGSRSCDSFDVYHSLFVPPETMQLNL